MKSECAPKPSSEQIHPSHTSHTLQSTPEVTDDLSRLKSVVRAQPIWIGKYCRETFRVESLIGTELNTTLQTEMRDTCFTTRIAIYLERFQGTEAPVAIYEEAGVSWLHLRSDSGRPIVLYTDDRGRSSWGESLEIPFPSWNSAENAGWLIREMIRKAQTGQPMN